MYEFARRTRGLDPALHAGGRPRDLGRISELVQRILVFIESAALLWQRFRRRLGPEGCARFDALLARCRGRVWTLPPAE